jgi:hypothetical protein
MIKLVITSSTAAVPEDECVYCSKWPQADREAKRLLLTDHMAGLCLCCMQAGYENRSRAAEPIKPIHESECVICKDWPPAERAQRRSQHFSTDYIEIPTKGVCELCQSVFCEKLSGAPTKH